MLLFVVPHLLKHSEIIRSFGLFYQAYVIKKIKNGLISYDPITKLLTKTPLHFLNGAGMNYFTLATKPCIKQNL